MKILVCGGAGYIGSHMCRMLAGHGHEVTVFDNLATGFSDAVRWGALVKGDLLDQAAVDRCLAAGNFDAVMHFSALSIVSESVSDPDRYYENNVSGTLNLLDSMVRHGLNSFVFSSSASVYGAVESKIITEETPLAPINPYGMSKWMVERMLADFAQAHHLRSVAFRYFNAAGADPSGELGEDHEPETHLIPNILNSLAGKSTKKFSLYGTDYPTPDGTCIRDYIHVNDICRAHLAALAYLQEGGDSDCFNIGNGNGFSVLEVIEAAEQVTGRKLDYDKLGRRAGDPAVLVADSSKLQRTLGWQPEFPELAEIIETAWRYHSR